MTGIIIALSFVIGFLVIMPAVKHIRQLQNEINSTQQFLEDQYEKTQKMRRSTHNLAEIVNQVEKFKDISATEGPELEVITQLENIASEHNVDQTLKATYQEKSNIASVKASLPVLLRDKNYYIFSFYGEGKYEDLMEYLKAIEELPYYFSINSVQLSVKSDSDISTIRFDGLLFIFED